MQLTKSDLQNKMAVCQRIASLVRARLPIAGELAKPQSSMSSSANKLAASVDQDIQQGKSLVAALASDSDPHSRVLAACIEAGEKSNAVDQTLHSWTGIHIASSRARRTYIVALLYPTLLILTTLVSLSFVAWKLIPQYELTYSTFEQTLPGWLQAIVWLRNQFWLLTIGLAVLILSPLLLWYFSRRRRAANGFIRDRAEQERVQWLAADLAATMLKAERPLNEIAPLITRAAGGDQKAVENAFASLQAQRDLSPVAQETSTVLSALYSGVLSPKEALHHLNEVADHFTQSAERYDSKQARWIPMFVAIVVGVITVASYTFLIYLPWIWLMREIVEDNGDAMVF
ncbi:MAG: type II secretion system F family protein [Planctomycetota bacterium]